MAYENLKLVTSIVGGEIYIAKAKDGEMSTKYRRVITDEVLSSSIEWFLANEKEAISFSGADGNTHSLFYTSDENKRSKIMQILNEKDNKS